MPTLSEHLQHLQHFELSLFSISIAEFVPRLSGAGDCTTLINSYKDKIMNNLLSMHRYSSNAEYDFHKRHPDLIYKHQEVFRKNFYDSNNISFKAMPDFYDPTNQTYIEFKCHKLNKSKTKQQAEENLSLKLRFSKTEKARKYAQLLCGWNHSVYKHGIVSNALNGISKYIVIFKDDTKLTTCKRGDIDYMEQQGVVWQYEKDYFFV